LQVLIILCISVIGRAQQPANGRDSCQHDIYKSDIRLYGYRRTGSSSTEGVLSQHIFLI